ncbi:hypothetical protein [Candidatus Nitrosocosmicus franklandus]|nr:hypothetical protein [Candidatus Nitrosocosmicus franklandus]
MDIEVNSTSGFQPIVSLQADNLPKGINLIIADSKIPVPPYGIVTTIF